MNAPKGTVAIPTIHLADGRTRKILTTEEMAVRMLKAWRLEHPEAEWPSAGEVIWLFKNSFNFPCGRSTAGRALVRVRGN